MLVSLVGATPSLGEPVAHLIAWCRDGGLMERLLRRRRAFYALDKTGTQSLVCFDGFEWHWAGSHLPTEGE